MVSQTTNTVKTYELRHIHKNEMCRICMLSSEYLKNSSHDLTPKLCKMLSTSTQINVSINDGFPQLVCNNCYKQLHETYKFVLLAKNTSRKFRKYDKPVINKLNETTEQRKVTTVLDTAIKQEIVPNVVNINTYFNMETVKDQKKTNQPLKSKNSINNKENTTVSNKIKRFILRSDLTRKPENVTLENNNNLNITTSNGANELKENQDIKPVLIRRSLNKKSKQKPKVEKNRIDSKYSKHSMHKEENINHRSSRGSDIIKDIKNEPISPKLEDILLAVGLVRKVSTEINTTTKYDCEVCKEKFSHIQTYKKHLSTIHQIFTYECRFCGNKFPSRLILKKHKEKVHKGKSPYHCLTCNATFKKFDNLLIHIKKKHVKKLPFTCKYCKNDFLTKEKLKEHLQTHLKIKGNSNLNKKFSCENCDKKFRKKSDLMRHLRIHTGERPYVCDVCHSGFQQAHNLTKHMVIHTREKSFVCDICKKHFGRNDSMMRHMLVHSIEKPFVCPQCKKGFTRQSQLSQHIKNNHPGDKNILDPLKKEI